MMKTVKTVVTTKAIVSICVDEQEKQLVRFSTYATKRTDNEKALAKIAKADAEAHGLIFVKVESVETIKIKYEMSQEKFIQNAENSEVL